MAELRVASLERAGERGFTLLCRDGAGAPLARCTVLAVDDACVRVVLCRCDDAAADAPLPPPRTPAVLPGLGRVTASVVATSDAVELRTAALTLRATLSPSLSLQWARAEAHGGAVFAQDRASRAYALGRGTPHAAHAARRGEDDAFYGLGDKTGALDLAGRRLRTLMTDALGREPECVCAVAPRWNKGASNAPYRTAGGATRAISTGPLWWCARAASAPSAAARRGRVTGRRRRRRTGRATACTMTRPAPLTLTWAASAATTTGAPYRAHSTRAVVVRRPTAHRSDSAVRCVHAARIAASRLAKARLITISSSAPRCLR